MPESFISISRHESYMSYWIKLIRYKLDLRTLQGRTMSTKSTTSWHNLETNEATIVCFIFLAFYYKKGSETRLSHILNSKSESAKARTTSALTSLKVQKQGQHLQVWKCTSKDNIYINKSKSAKARTTFTSLKVVYTYHHVTDWKKLKMDQ